MPPPNKKRRKTLKQARNSIGFSKSEEVEEILFDQYEFYVCIARRRSQRMKKRK
jgi:hypothetical protein